MNGLAARWPLPGLVEVRDRLLGAYEGRGYHDSQHLEEVLQRIDELGGGDDVNLALAAWFHDAVYAGAPEDEERSALLAEDLLADAAGVDVDAVARLVRLTATHDPADDDMAGKILCDADLAILAAGPARYAEYVSGVRRDYAAVSEEDFRTGRRAVLTELLGRSRLFRTTFARTTWEPAARVNLRAELDRLS